MSLAGRGFLCLLGHRQVPVRPGIGEVVVGSPVSLGVSELLAGQAVSGCDWGGEGWNTGSAPSADVNCRTCMKSKSLLGAEDNLLLGQ